MSIYNIEYQTAFNYYKKHRELLLCMSDKEYVNKYFLIGEKSTNNNNNNNKDKGNSKNSIVDKKEQQFSQIMIEMLCTENCELINYINDKIEGKEDLCHSTQKAHHNK